MDDFLTVFTNFKNILCVCPNCQSLPRLSELQIFSTKKAPKDWMDDWRQRMNNLQEKINEFSEWLDSGKSSYTKKIILKVMLQPYQILLN